jgi:hypothetical protein
LQGKFVNDYWETSKKMLSDMGFLDSLKSYDKVRLRDILRNLLARELPAKYA